MANPFNIDSIPDEFFAILTSIVKRRGSTIEQLQKDTVIPHEKLVNTINLYFDLGYLEIDEYTEKYYVTKQLWSYWQMSGFKDKITTGLRSNWLEYSPVKDWYPLNFQPKPTLVYYIGPYKEPYRRIYNEIIKPTVEDLGLVCETAIDDPGSEEFLKDKILPNLLNARFVICDLSESNPNVHYELGWLHAFGTPFLAYTSTARPSDIQHLTINRIEFSESGLEVLKGLIISSLQKNEIGIPYLNSSPNSN